MPEQIIKFAFKGKPEHISEVSIENLANPNQHDCIEIPHDSRDHVFVPDTVKLKFNLEFESTDKTCSIVNNVARVSVKKKLLILGSKEIDAINNSDIYGTYKDLSFSRKARAESLQLFS